MKILAVGCIHNDVENLLLFIDKLASFEFDVVVCPGDFTDNLFPRGFTRKDVATLILEELRSFGKPLFVVPGSWDKDLAGLFEEEGVSLHGIGKIYQNVGFFGYGGARTPFGLPLEPSEDEMARGLTNAYKDIEGVENRVMVTHAPPANTKADIISSGAHVGSEAVRKFIETAKPTVAICSHIHESKGTDSIGNTHVMNCGRFPEGYCGLITIEKGLVAGKVVSLI